PGVAELVFFSTGCDQAALARGKLCALSNHNDAEVAAAIMSHSDFCGYFIHVEGLLRNQDHVGTAGDAAVDSDPASIATHDFNHHDAVVGLGRSVYPIDGLGDDVDGGVEAESEVGAAEVVVDGFWHADYLDAPVEELGCDRKCVVAPDGNQGVTIVLL